MMKAKNSQSVVLLLLILASSFSYAADFETLKPSSSLSQECAQDAPDVFKSKTYPINRGTVVLKTYSCRTQQQDQTQYYSVYALTLDAKKTLYFKDGGSDGNGYVGISANKVDADTLVFDSMFERGGDLILVWIQDLKHIYALKIPYMAADEGGVKLYSKKDQILIQKVMIKAVINAKPLYENVGKPIVFQKIKDKGLIFLSGHLKKFQTEIGE